MPYPKLAALLTVVAISLAACHSADRAPPRVETLDPVKMQAYIRRNFSHIPNLTAAIDRVIEAANGAHPDGVAYTTSAAGIRGRLLVDVKGDGTDTARADLTITYTTPSLGIAGGAAVTIANLTSPNLIGSANGTLAITGGGSTITLTNGSAELKYPDNPRMIISAANLSVTAGNLGSPNGLAGPATILGSADFRADTKSGTIFFEGSAAGGWRIRVVSPDFATFIVP